MLLKYTMEDQVLGTTCHIGQESSHTQCLRVSVRPCMAMLCCRTGRSNLPIVSQQLLRAAGASWVSHIYPQYSLTCCTAVGRLPPLKKAKHKTLLQ